MLSLSNLLKSTLLMLCLTGSAAQADQAIKVRVATESWGQLMYLDNRKVPRGVIADFVNRMNAVQSKYRFELAIYPRLRLDQVFIDRQADMYPLRTVAWTKPELNLLPTRTLCGIL